MRCTVNDLQRARRAQINPLRSAARDFAVWARSGATPLQALRQAANTFRALCAY